MLKFGLPGCSSRSLNSKVMGDMFVVTSSEFMKRLLPALNNTV